MSGSSHRSVGARLATVARGLTRDGRGLTLAAVAGGWFLTIGVRFLVPALLPQIKGEFRVDNATAGAAITVIWACYGLVQFPSGVMIHRMGERRLLMASLVLAAASLGLMCFAPVFVVFIVAAAILGFATGIYGPPRGTVVSKTFRDHDSAAFGITIAAGSVGSATLPFVGSVLVSRLGWRGTVAVAVPFFLVAAVLVFRHVPALEIDDTAERTPSEHLERLIEAITDRTVLLAIFAFTLMLFTFQALTAFLPTYLIEMKGLSQSTAASLFALLFVCGAAFQVTLGSMADRLGDRAVLASVSTVGVFTLAALPFLSGLVPLALVVVALASRFTVIPVSNSYVISILPDDVQGSAWGLARAGFFLVGATGSTFVGVLADAGLFDEAFYVLAGITAVAAVLYLWLPERAAVNVG